MDKPENPSPAPLYPGSIAMARIDGSRVRRIREQKGLTQLYLATVIGVTTDTISRWENKRYPSIKLENAEKLAEALEVTLEEILEEEDSETPASPETPLGTSSPTETGEAADEAASDREKPAPAPPARRRSLLIWLLPLALGVAGLLLWPRPEPPHEEEVTVSAQRILPAHIPAGQKFPVLIRVETSEPGPVSLLLKETLPAGCLATGGEPGFTSQDARSGELKWIRRSSDRQTVFAYLAQAPAEAEAGTTLGFSGSVTLKQEGQSMTAIAGDTTMTIAPYHWADSDRDGTVDDEEILAVYDRYADITALEFNRDLIDDIWASGGYRWDPKKKTYAVVEEDDGR